MPPFPTRKWLNDKGRVGHHTPLAPYSFPRRKPIPKTHFRDCSQRLPRLQLSHVQPLRYNPGTTGVSVTFVTHRHRWVIGSTLTLLRFHTTRPQHPIQDVDIRFIRPLLVANDDLRCLKLS